MTGTIIEKRIARPGFGTLVPNKLKSKKSATADSAHVADRRQREDKALQPLNSFLKKEKRRRHRSARFKRPRPDLDGPFVLVTDLMEQAPKDPSLERR